MIKIDGSHKENVKMSRSFIKGMNYFQGELKISQIVSSEPN